jgi:hemoglobin
MQHDTSIYAAIGGQPAVMAAVEEFYRRVLADPALAPYFAGIPVKRLKGHQAAFFAMALGGPDRYKGRSMQEAHAGRGITDADFDRVAGHLVATLAALGVDQGTISRIIGHVAPLRTEIVEAPAEQAAA